MDNITNITSITSIPIRNVAPATHHGELIRTGECPAKPQIDLRPLDPDERALVLRHARDGLSLNGHGTTPPPDLQPASILAYLRALDEAERQEAERQERERAEREAAAREHAEAALADPGCWVAASGGVVAYPCPRDYRSWRRDDYRAAYDSVPGVPEARAAAAERYRREAAAERERKAAERERKEAEHTATRDAWIGEHGSDRLRRLLAEGIELETVYRDERLAAERPGWRWERDVLGSEREPRNAPLSALTLLDDARASLPEAERDGAKLRWWIIERCDEEECDGGEDCRNWHDGWRGYVVTAEYLERTILYGGPGADDEEVSP